MTDHQAVWRELTAKAYERKVERMLRSAANMQRIFKAEHDAWWAKQTRWFKIHYRARNLIERYRSRLRYRIANAIYPYPEDLDY